MVGKGFDESGEEGCRKIREWDCVDYEFNPGPDPGPKRERTTLCTPRIVNSLPAIGAHERHDFDKLLWGLVTSTVFVRC